MKKEIHYCEDYSHAVALYDDTWAPEDISLVVNNIHKDETVALTAGDLQDLMTVGQRYGAQDKTPNGMVRSMLEYMAWCIGKGYEDFRDESRCREWLAEARKGRVSFHTVTPGGCEQATLLEPLPPWYGPFVKGKRVPTYGAGTIGRNKRGEE